MMKIIKKVKDFMRVPPIYLMLILQPIPGVIPVYNTLVKKMKRKLPYREKLTNGPESIPHPRAGSINGAGTVEEGVLDSPSYTNLFTDIPPDARAKKKNGFNNVDLYPAAHPGWREYIVVPT